MLLPTALTLAIVSTLPAQESRPAPAPARLKAQVVTATGYADDPLDLPVATEQHSGEDLRRNGADDPGRALAGRAGLANASDGAAGGNPVIRGLKKESLVLQVDGLRLNSAQPAGAIAALTSLALAESLEVVRGPASVRHGTGALGGVINVQMPQAHFDQPDRVRLGAAVSSCEDAQHLNGVGQWSAGDQALMLGAAGSHQEGYDSPNGPVAYTGYERDSLIGQYRLRLADRHQLRLSAQQHSDRDVWYPGSAKPHPLPLVRRTLVQAPETSRSLLETAYSYHRDPQGEAQFDLRVYQQDVERRIESWSEGRRANMAQTRVRFATDGLELRGDLLENASHRLSAGLQHWQMRANPARELARPPSFVFQRADPFRQGEIEATGLWLQDDWQGERWRLLAGLRQDQVEGRAAAVAGRPPGSDLSRRDRALSGSLGLSYALTPLLHPYLNLSRGFRAGEMRERFESSPRGDGYFYAGNPQIRPETADQIELGLKWRSETLELQFALFDNQIQNHISGEDISGTPMAAQLCGPADAGACKRTVNLGEADIRGLEFSGQWRWQEHHQLQADITVLRGENRSLGEPLQQMPADQLRLGWRSQWGQWGLDADLRALRRQDRVARRFTRGGENPTPGYSLLDLGADWQLGVHHLRLTVSNLLDRDYHDHLADGLSGAEPAAPGRSFRLAWRGEF